MFLFIVFFNNVIYNILRSLFIIVYVNKFNVVWDIEGFIENKWKKVIVLKWRFFDIVKCRDGFFMVFNVGCYIEL